jgi:hypothetical protein
MACTQTSYNWATNIALEMFFLPVGSSAKTETTDHKRHGYQLSEILPTQCSSLCGSPLRSLCERVGRNARFITNKLRIHKYTAHVITLGEI